MDRLYEQGSISNLEPCRQSGAVVQQALRKARPLIPSVLLRPLLGAFGIWRVHRDHTATFDRRGGLGRIHILMAGVIVADRLSVNPIRAESRIEPKSHEAPASREEILL